MHLVQVVKVVHVGHDATRERSVLKVVEHAVHLVEVTLGVMRLLSDLVTVGLTDRAGLVCPLVPDVTVQIVNIVRLLLVDPQHLVHRALKRRAAKRQRGKLLAQIVAGGNAKVLDGKGGSPVLPVRTDLLALGSGSMVQNALAHVNKQLVRFAHRRDSFTSETRCPGGTNAKARASKSSRVQKLELALHLLLHLTQHVHIGVAETHV